MSGRQHLFVPGPTHLPERVRRAMTRAAEDHRSVSFPDLVRPLLAGVARLFDTEQSVAMVPTTGTGGWQAALVNTLPPGATLLQTGAGHFANLWSDLASGLGFKVERMSELQWGQAPSAEQLEARLKHDSGHHIAAVLVVHNETSTGVTAHLPSIRGAIDAVGHPALLLSDGVSSVGSIPYHHDTWGVDVAITGSQKGLMLPAGLALMAFSRRARALVDSVRSPRGFFDLRPMFAQNAEGYFPFTPPVPMLYGLAESLEMLFDEGMENVWSRHHRIANGVRAAVDAWGFSRCCREWRDASNTVTTVMLPETINADILLSHSHSDYQLDLGGGLGQLSGRAFRIGHMGDINEGMVLGALGLIELALSDLGHRLQFGSGPAAALRAWAEVE